MSTMYVVEEKDSLNHLPYYTSHVCQFYFRKLITMVRQFSRLTSEVPRPRELVWLPSYRDNLVISDHAIAN